MLDDLSLFIQSIDTADIESIQKHVSALNDKPEPLSKAQLGKIQSLLLDLASENENDKAMALLNLNVIRNDLDFIYKLHYAAFEALNEMLHSYTVGIIIEDLQKSAIYTDEQIAQVNSDIPKAFHFIWMGKTIPEHLANNIRSMISVAKQSQFDIYLWTDNISKQEAAFLELPKAARDKLKIVDIKELYTTIDEEFDETVEELGVKKSTILKGFLDQERAGFFNYAAASDLLRMLILLSQGGLYIDCDIKLKADSPRAILELNNDIGVMQLFKIMSMHMGPEIFMDRNDMLASSQNHPIYRQAIDLWLKIYLNQERNRLPHETENKVGFVPSVTDQRRFGQSHYEKIARESMLKGQLKPKEMETGNLGVMPISAATKAFLEAYNKKNATSLQVKDIAFGYKMELSPTGNSKTINAGGLLFDHVLDHAWLDQGKKRKPTEI